MVELSDGDQGPFGIIAATGFGLPAWASTLFARLPGREGWRCYVAHVDGEAQACGAMLIDGGVAELGIGATLESGRRRGCQLALLHRRILDAADAGCQTLFVETGERSDRPALEQLPQHPPRRLQGGLPLPELATSPALTLPGAAGG